MTASVGLPVWFYESAKQTTPWAGWITALSSGAALVNVGGFRPDGSPFASASLPFLEGNARNAQGGAFAMPVGTPVPAPVPVPVPPKPTPEPPKPTPPTLGSFGPSGQGTRFESKLGVINCWELPPNCGTIVSTALPETPQELKLEWCISPTPGDFAYAKTAPASVVGRGGVVYYPCVQEGGVESGGVKCGPTAANDVCAVPANAKWYVSMRYVSGIPADTPVPITYSWAPRAV